MTSLQKLLYLSHLPYIPLPQWPLKPAFLCICHLHCATFCMLADRPERPFILYMKQEQSPSLEEQCTWQQDKLRTIYHRIEGCIDRFIELYSQAERAAQSGQDTREVIAHLNRELLALKPLKTVREHFVHHYRKLSNLLRRVQTPNNGRNGVASSRYSRRANSQQPSHQLEHKQADEKISRFFRGFLNRPQDFEVLEELIVENYLRNGEWGCAGVWKDMETKIDSPGLFRQSINLRESIRKGQLTEAIKWCENERLYETHNCCLEYDLKLMHLLGLIEGGNSQQILNYYMGSFGKFFEDKKEEMEKLSLHIFFRINKFWEGQGIQDADFKEKLNERYKIFEYSPAKLQRLADEFFDQYMKQNNLPKFNSLSIVYSCSQKIMEEYMRMMKLVWGGKEKPNDKKDSPILPFSVKIDRDYQYHSLFFCPVTKEVHSSNEASKLLACGHLISDNAHNRIVQENRNRRKIKCPICQKQIRPDDSLKTEF